MDCDQFDYLNILNKDDIRLNKITTTKSPKKNGNIVERAFAGFCVALTLTTVSLELAVCVALN